MIKEQYIILTIRYSALKIATSTRFNHEYEAKEWINDNGKPNIGYVIIKEYLKQSL